MRNIIRHGDVLLIPVKALPKNAKKVKDTNKHIAAEGETTGHKHVLAVVDKTIFDGIGVYEVDGEYHYVVTEPAQITHEEHKPLAVPPGIHKQAFKREKDWFSLSVRRVVD